MRRRCRMQQTRWVLAVLAMIAVVAASTSSAGAGIYEPTTVTARDVRFEAGDVLTVALHPSTTPIELSTRRLDLEACPGSWDGEVGTAANTSWPTRDGFTKCIPFSDDSTVVLPSAGSGGGAMHLVFAVRARAANARPGTLTIRYEPVDGFFMVTPAAVQPGARTPTIVLAPTTDTVAAGTAAVGDDRPPSSRDVRIVVRQRGRVVPESPSEELAVQHMWPVFQPVKPGQPVGIRAVNDGDVSIRFAIGVDVG